MKKTMGKSQFTVTGSLLGQIAAQVGGSLVGLFKRTQFPPAHPHVLLERILLGLSVDRSV